MRRNKGLLVLALLGLLTMMISVTVGATASASGGKAVAAKKKCKKKKNHAASAKKKKCKKKAAPVSLVRATLTWSGGGDSTDYNLSVFDPSGSTGSVLSNPISSTTFSPNAKGSSGTETFTDLDFGKHRAFAFGVCHQDGGTTGPRTASSTCPRMGPTSRTPRPGRVMDSTRGTATAVGRPQRTRSPVRLPSRTYMRRVGSSYPLRPCGYSSLSLEAPPPPCRTSS